MQGDLLLANEAKPLKQRCLAVLGSGVVSSNLSLGGEKVGPLPATPPGVVV